MTADRWTVTHQENRPDGSVRLRGVHPDAGPFVVTIPLEEYATMGPHAAIRAYYADPPHQLRRPR